VGLLRVRDMLLGSAPCPTFRFSIGDVRGVLKKVIVETIELSIVVS
jgi:hypothetical protein